MKPTDFPLLRFPNVKDLQDAYAYNVECQHVYDQLKSDLDAIERDGEMFSHNVLTAHNFRVHSQVIRMEMGSALDALVTSQSLLAWHIWRYERGTAQPFAVPSQYGYN